MHERIRNHVTSLLASAPDCPERAEITEEMTQNLTEKYDDLIAQGRDPDDAYREVLSGIGDVSEIIRFIRDAYSERQERSQSGATTAPFGDFEDRVRDWGEQLAKNLEEPIRTMTSDIKAAAKQFQASAKRNGRDFRYDYTLEPDGIESLLVELRSGDFSISLSPDEKIHVTEYSRAQLRDDQRLSFDQKGDCLRISQGRNYVGFFLFGFGVLTSDVHVELPDVLWKSIRATGVMDVNVSSLRCRSLYLKSTSGDICIENIDTGFLFIESISGDVGLSGRADSADIRTKSGDLDLHSMSVGELSIDKIAGDLIFSGQVSTVSVKSKSGDTHLVTQSLPNKLSIDSISGNVRITFPENSGFSLTYSRVSGNLKSDFNLMTPLNSRSGTAVYKNGREPAFTISTVSGDITIKRA